MEGDRVEIDEGIAWLEFEIDDAKVHWDLEVNNDWLDPNIFLKYDRLLSDHTDLRLYSNTRDFGQVALLGCFSKREFDAFNKLSKVRLRAIG